MKELSPLDFDPFEGDFGDQSDRNLADKMVVGRKLYACNHCGQPIAIGERHRHKRGVYDGDFMQWRWCALCCEAMVQTMSPPDEEDDPTGELYDDAIMAFERRADLRQPEIGSVADVVFVLADLETNSKEDCLKTLESLPPYEIPRKESPNE